MPIPYAKQLAYRANARAVGRRWRDYLQLVVVVIVLSAGAALTPHWPAKEYVLGFAVGTIVMTMVLATVRMHDPQVAGYAAETFSVEALRRVRGWTVIDNLRFDRVDVDHVAVTPATILAVETKHHGHLPPTHPAARDRARRDLQAAHASARKLTSLLRANKLHAAATITPVLMIWGPGSPNLDRGYRVVDDVYLVDADHPELWQHLFAAPRIATADRAEVVDALRRFSKKRDEYDSATCRPLHRMLAVEFRDGVRSERAARARRREVRASISKRHSPQRLAPAQGD